MHAVPEGASARSAAHGCPATEPLPIPPGFRYADLLRRGRPRHGAPGRPATYDAFYRRHPPMPCSRRAKIFAPFDALAGFSQRISDKEVLYRDRLELAEGEREDLDRKIAILHSLTANSRMARENRVPAEITYFAPCADPENAAYGKKQGQYRTLTGIVRRVDVRNRAILLDTTDSPAPPAAGGQAGHAPGRGPARPDAGRGADLPVSIPAADIIGIRIRPATT